jgi:hypothetical protein
VITIDTLLSGFIGAILAIFYQRYRDKKEKEYILAKDRIDNIYGPLLLIFDANKDLNKSDEEKFLFGKEEEKLIDGLLFQNYGLIEEGKRSILLNLYSHRKISATDKDIIDAIKNGYNENLAILSQRNILSEIKDYIKKMK